MPQITNTAVVWACVRANIGMPRRAFDILKKETGASDAKILRAMNRACNLGLIQYGVSVETAWATPESEKCGFVRGYHSTPHRGCILR